MDPAVIESLGRSWVSWLGATNLWTLGALAAVVIFDHLAARHVSPGWRMALYVVVLARLVWPGVWTSPVGLVPGQSLAPAGSAVGALATGLAPPQMAIVAGEAAPRWSWGTGALLVHFSGTVVLLLRLIVGQQRLNRIRAIASQIDPRGTDGVQVLEHPSAGPMALGVLDPVIVLPTEALELPAAELGSILRHERARLRHRDPALALGLLLLRALMWPVAAVWLAAVRLHTLMEVRADAAATRPLNAAATREYGALLLRAATMGKLTPPAMGVGHREIRARLRALGRRPRVSVPVQVTAVVLAAAASATLIAERTGSEPAPENLQTTVSGASAPAGSEHCVLDREWMRPDVPGATTADERFARAQVMLEAGELKDAESELRETAWLAASVKYDDLAAAAAGQLMSVTLAREEAGVARGWGAHAAAAYQRAAGSREAVAFHQRRAELLAALDDSQGAAESRATADALSALCR
ncbi:MAG: M56 family metallopeptidase [Nannocystaceae bacterium]|nr:M56 family metallopeptidase [Nannocystaceae bacterium]